MMRSSDARPAPSCSCFSPWRPSRRARARRGGHPHRHAESGVRAVGRRHDHPDLGRHRRRLRPDLGVGRLRRGGVGRLRIHRLAAAAVDPGRPQLRLPAVRRGRPRHRRRVRHRHHGALLYASPPPVASAGGSAPTAITWDTGVAFGQVRVSMNGGPEVTFAIAARGTQAAPWVQAGALYTFTLYAGDIALASIQVRAGPSLSAAPNPVDLQAATGTSVISWSTGSGGVGQVWLSVNGTARCCSPRARQGCGARRGSRPGRTSASRCTRGSAASRRWRPPPSTAAPRCRSPSRPR